MSGYSLDQNQLKAVSHKTKEHALVIAGPGSGKTTVVCYRYFKNIQNKKYTLCLTFSNKATNEMKKRISNMNISANVYSFHGFAYKILQQYQLINRDILSEYEQKKICDKLYIDQNKLNNFHRGMGFKPQNYDHYINYCEKNKLIDFAYILYLFVDILKNNKNISFSYDEIIIDEFQDINFIQKELILAISKHNSQKNTILFAVGDDDQAIYGWRGSKSIYMIDFHKYFGQYSSYFLSVNYRSYKKIVDFARLTIEKNKKRISKNIQPFYKEEGKVEVLYSVQNKDLVKLIKESEGSVGILCRKGSLIPKIEQLLKKNKIFCQSLQFFEEKSIEMLINYLSIIKKPNFEALKYISKGDKIGIGEKTLAKIKNYKNITEALEKYKKSLLELLNNWKILPIKQQIEEIIQHSKICNPIDHRPDLKKTLMIIIEKYSLQGLFSRDNGLIQDNSVQIMTIHKSKGLEFDNVFIPDLIEGEFPAIKTQYPQEERRVFYVALTRAKKNLFLLYGPHYKFFGPSRYIVPLLY